MIIVFHADCCDGFTAASVLSARYPDATFVPARYDEPMDPTPGEHYIFVDFCYARAVMDEFLAAASSLLVLDHHKTAAADMVGFPNCVFSMEKSGAQLAWDHVHPGEAPSLLVAYVEDRDLWRHALPYTREINAVIQNAEKSFEHWTFLDTRLYWEQEEIIIEGRAILGAEAVQLEYLKGLAYKGWLFKDGVDVPVVNSPTLVSELLNALCVGQPYAVSYHRLANGRWKYSLRSDANGVDVSEIAKRYPWGGGHAHAAGFTSQDGPDEI